MLSAHDDVALEALANKGLVRRAFKDIEKGNVTLIDHDGARATLRVEEHEVVMTSLGPGRAVCTCPANTVCKHILAAVIYLRDSVKPDDERESAGSSEPAQAETASDMLLSLSDDEIRKFAGKDLAAALAFLQNDHFPRFETDSASLQALFPDEIATITFIAGRPLSEAVCKGPKTRTRLLVAAAAIAFRRSEGQALPDVSGEAVPDQTHLDVASLEAIARVLETALKATLCGTSEMAQEQVFDLVVSTRVLAAPRLTSQLRRVQKMMGQAREQHIAFSPERFLKQVANTYALTRALMKSPNDRVLTGDLRRDYQPGESLSLIMLGAGAWTTETGARGLTVYGYAPETGRWCTTTTARAANMDPTFTPHSAYQASLWATAAPKDLMGAVLHLETPQMANETEIAYSWKGAVEQSPGVLNCQDIDDIGAAVNTWKDSRALRLLKSRVGLRQYALRSPELLAPRSIADPVFSEIEQCYFLDLLDQTGDRATLRFPARDYEQMRSIIELKPRIHSVLVEFSRNEPGIEGRLVSLLIRDGKRLLVQNVGLDHFYKTSLIGKALNQIKERIPLRGQMSHARMSRVETLLGLVDDLALSSLQRLVPQDRLAEAIANCDSLGLQTLGLALQRLQLDASVRNTLAVAYMNNLAADCYDLRKSD